jgi:hypothetical protein
MALEVLDLTLVLLGGIPRFERAEVFALLGLGIDLPRIKTVLARLQLADHSSLLNPY